MSLKYASAIGLFAVSALLAAGGCGRPLGGAAAATRPATAAQPVVDDFAALPVPPDFDRQKAMLPLAKVPGDPPAPAAAGDTQDAELPRQALRRIEEARRLFSEQRYSETIQELEGALRYNANSHEAHRMMALASLWSGDDERAGASAGRALAIKPNDPAAHYVLGRVREKADKKDDALREYRLAVKSDPAGPQTPYRLLANYYLGNLLYDSGYYTAAVEQLAAFEAGLAAWGDKTAEDPELATLARVHRGTAAVRVARAYGLLGDYIRAADSLKVAVAQSPKDHALRAEYIRALGRAKRLDEAAREAAGFATETKGGPEAVQLLMAVHRRAGHPERALDVIRQLATAQPDNIDLWKLYIDALSAARKFDDAVAALNELVARHPDATDSRWRLIQLARERGDWPKWMGALVQHLQRQPQDQTRVEEEFSKLPPETARQIAAEIGRPAAQRKLLPAEPSGARGGAALNVLLARLSERLKDPQKAHTLFEGALVLAPGFTPAVVGLAEPLVGACRWQDALKIMQAGAQDGEPPSARLEVLRARACDGLDDFDAAVERYKKAVELDKTDADSLLMLAQIHERVGQTKEAQPFYQKAIAAAPANMYARELFVRSLLNQAAQSGRPGGRFAAEIRDMQRLAAHDPATLRSAALAELVTQGPPARQAYVETLRSLVKNSPEDLRSREAMIAILLAMREYVEARAQAEELLGREPYSDEAAELLAVAHARRLDFSAAAAQLDRALAIYPHRESLILRRAQAALVQQDYDTAIKLYRGLLDLKHAAPRQGAYRQALVEAYREAHRFDEARRDLEAWLAKAKDETETMLLRDALLAMDAGAQDQARYEVRVREWLKAGPENMNLRLLLLGDENLRLPLLGGQAVAVGRAGLIGQGCYDQAALLCLRWLGEDTEGKPDVPANDMRRLRLMSRLLTTLQAAGRHAEAIELARAEVAAGKNENERAVAQLFLRAAYVRAGKMDEAIALTEELLGADRDEDLGDVQLLVNLLSNAGRHDEAVNQVNKLIANLSQQKAQIEALGEKETEPQRRQAIQRALDQLRVQHALLLRAMSYVYQRMGRADLAKTHLREAYQLDPAYIGTNNDLGYLLADSGDDLNEAERLVRVALAEEPRNAAYQDSYAWVLYKRGDLAGARTWLLRATALDEGRDPVVYDHLADVQWRLGEKDAAPKNWRKSLEIYETQSRLGEVETEKDVVDRVKAKLAAVEAGREPKVAPTAAETRPAP